MSDILRAALEPFARCADTFSDEMPDNLQVIIEEPGIRVVTLGDLRKARAALAGQLYNYQTTLPVKWSTLRDEHESAGANIAYEAMRDRCKPGRRRKLLAIASDHFTIAAGLRDLATRAE